jgi:hypothetical protein
VLAAHVRIARAEIGAPVPPSPLSVVMPGLGPGIHVFLDVGEQEDVDGRDEPGHDEVDECLRKS